MAQVIRSVLIDIFKEAQHFGEVPPGYNPALATKQPRRRINRQQLSLEEWRKIFDIADATHRYMGERYATGSRHWSTIGRHLKHEVHRRMG